MNEKISSMIDGELSEDALGSELKSLENDDLRIIERYQLIGVLMRKECSDSAVRMCREASADRISERIADEPSWALPTSGKRHLAARRPRHAPAFWGGFAAAAAIAAVAVMVLPPIATDSGEPAATVASTTETAVASPTANMDELNAYLVEHGEFTGSAGLNGLVAYAKFVSSGDH